MKCRDYVPTLVCTRLKRLESVLFCHTSHGTFLDEAFVFEVHFVPDKGNWNIFNGFNLPVPVKSTVERGLVCDVVDNEYAVGATNVRTIQSTEVFLALRVTQRYHYW